jgi:hypothetical protein
VENNQVSTILVFKRNFVDLFGQCLQQQQTQSCIRYLPFYQNSKQTKTVK